MKKLISLLLSATLLAGTFATTVMAETATATVAMYLQSADYNTNQAVLALTLEGVEADSYTYQWYNSTEENGTYLPMYKETNSTYVLSSNDYNTYMRCEITPYKDGVAGNMFTSDTYFLSTAKDSMRIGAIKRDQTTIANYKDNPGTYRVNVGGENIIILDEYADSFYAITDGFKGWKNFGDSTTCQFLPNDTSNIGYWLNNEFLTTNQISADIQKYIPSHDWWVEPGDDTVRTPYTFNAKVSLLSATEYGKYMDRIGWGPHDAGGDWWLRNSRPKTSGKTINVVIVTSNTTRYGDTNGGQAGNKQMLVRPTFYLSDDIFLEQKADVSTMGSGIKAMLMERYTLEELSNIYSKSELKQIGYDINVATLTSDTTPPAALSTLTVDYTVADAVSYEYKWLISDDGSSNWVTVKTQTNNTYRVANNDMNKYIKAQVTPVFADGSKGETVETENSINVTQLGVLNRTDYSAEEREANKNDPTANFVKIGDEEVLILDEYSDTTKSFYVMTKYAKGRAQFDADNTTKFDPSDSNNIAYILNGSLLSGGYTDNGTTYGISSTIQSYIPTVTWWTEAGASGSATPSDYSVDAKIGLMSRSEYAKYWGKFGWDPNEAIKSGWWLRTGRGKGGSDTSLFVALGTSNSYPTETSNSWGNTWNKDASSTYYMRPTFWLSEDVFRNVKADVTAMGSDVKAMLVERYEMEELAHLYTVEELGKIGYDTIISIPTTYKDVYSRSQAKIDVNYTAQASENITITYTNGTVSETVTRAVTEGSVHEETINMTKLPYGENDVTVTVKNAAGDTINTISNKKMYIVADQEDENIFNSGIGIHPAQCNGNNNIFPLAKKLGFTNVRIDFLWKYIEPSTIGEYDFELYDNIVTKANENGIELTAILCYNNLLYSDDGVEKSGIDTAAEIEGFVNYAKAVAQRYPGITKYEIWNEPNSEKFWANVNVTNYSNLVKAVEEALHGINPDITIYAGVVDISSTPETFIEGMYDNGLYEYMDGVSYHPYFNSEIADFEEEVETYKNLVVGNGGFKEAIITEYSYNMSDYNESERAREIVKAMVLAEAYNTEQKFVFNLISDDYGLFSNALVPTESIYTFAYANSALANSRFIGRLNTGDDTIKAHAFVKNGETVVVYWSTAGDSVLGGIFGGTDTLTLPQGAAAYDKNGNAISGTSITLSADPVYVYGYNCAQAAYENEVSIRNAEITSKYGVITSSILASSDPKNQIMALTSLTEEQKSIALYMLYEVNKIKAIYASLSDASALTIPTAEYESIDTDGNIYSAAALKLAKKYIDKSSAAAASGIEGKESIIAANNAIAKDLIDSARCFVDVKVTNVLVTDGVLTFDVKNAESCDVWVATYSGNLLLSVHKLTLDNLSCNIGNEHGKIFVWDDLTPLTDYVDF